MVSSKAYSAKRVRPLLSWSRSGIESGVESAGGEPGREAFPRREGRCRGVG